LDKDGSTLQEIPVEEAAKLGDAATRSLLRQVLVESSLEVAGKLNISKKKKIFGPKVFDFFGLIIFRLTFYKNKCV